MSEKNAKIYYTITDEAPALATYSFLPILKVFCSAANIDIDTADISLVNRILAQMNEHLPADKQVNDVLAQLGELVLEPHANIVKLPNISASVPQLKAAISELQKAGYPIPDYPEDPKNDVELKIQKAYNKAKGSAVNPVLREGNSDRRAPKAIKNYAKKNPHSMGKWSPTSASHVSTMGENDFCSNEKSVTLDRDCQVNIVHTNKNGEKNVLLSGLSLQHKEVIDGTFLSIKALKSFLEAQIADAKSKNILFSLHMKATMMKVSDPIIFGHAVRVFFKDVFDEFANELNSVDVDVDNGFGDLLVKIKQLPQNVQNNILNAIEKVYQKNPSLAMVNSDEGITNLHVPSDVIIDASMPAMIRNSGQMWNADGKSQDTKAVIPDSSYAGIYQEVIEFCKENGAFDPATMGTVPNVGLMAQKAEEYGSHNKTFELDADGLVEVVDDAGNVLISHEVEKGDIWRMCQTKDEPVKDWVKLAVKRSKDSNTPAVFWLDKNRAHDAALIEKVNAYLPLHDTNGLDIRILSPVEAMKFSLDRIKKGLDTISVTGNVLRDYNTDLFPIMEVGTSAKMLSIVPLMNGGGLFETGAGGSAPKHVQQFQEEGHLRWDSLGEFMAMSCSFVHFSEAHGNPKALVLSDALELAIEDFLDNKKSPSRRVNEIDNRGSHFYLALYWAKRLSEQNSDPELGAFFTPLYQKLAASEKTITAELIAAQGSPVEMGGYYAPDDELAGSAMRPSQTLNAILAEFE